MATIISFSDPTEIRPVRVTPNEMGGRYQVELGRSVYTYASSAEARILAAAWLEIADRLEVLELNQQVQR